MDLQKAMQLIDQALGLLKCTRQEHELLIEALRIIRDNLNAKVEKDGPLPAP